MVILWARGSTNGQSSGRDSVRLNGQALASLEATTAYDTSTILATHALEEAVYAETSTALGLPGSLHGDTLLRATLELAPA